ncbi:hypothetical protein [Pelagibacterium montanilacus]|uniref:hypothetical protein n=1 Tax=Pelagibacterium montanilacus TaxID=2185280 RepID=UPI000F8D0270|nr:hypothetical protein [Pelagibacterium montanilacus]
MKRRDILKALPGAALTPVALSAPAAADEVMTAYERLKYHLAEFKRAAEELDPMLVRWRLNLPERPGDPMLLVGNRVTGRYEGDGIYESGHETALGARIHYRVELTNEVIDGYRTFIVSCPGERSRRLEHVLETTIGKRIGDLA